MLNEMCINNDIERIKNIKRKFLTFACENKVEHLVSSLSSLEILYVLYNKKIANITKENLNAKVRDRVIISKEHARYAQCIILNDIGLLSDEVLETYMKDGGLLGHDVYNFVGSEHIAAIDIATGSLGHGIGVGTGLAIAAPKNHIYVLVGDGELQEGSCWEALMHIGHNRIKNITVIVDRNNYQIDNLTKNIIDSSKFAYAIEKFDFDIITINGHNIQELEFAFKKQTDKPKLIIANTIKGKELFFKQEKIGCARYHWSSINKEELKIALEELDNDPA